MEQDRIKEEVVYLAKGIRALEEQIALKTQSDREHIEKIEANIEETTEKERTAIMDMKKQIEDLRGICHHDFIDTRPQSSGEFELDDAASVCGKCGLREIHWLLYNGEWTDSLGGEWTIILDEFSD